MKRKFLTLAVLLLALQLNFMAEAKPGDWSVKKEFDAKPGQKLVLDLDLGASIQVEGWDQNKVTIDIDVDGYDKEELKLDFDESSDGISVYADDEYDDGCRRCRLEVVVKVPVKYDLDFNTQGGGIQLTNLHGELDGETMGGSLTLAKLKGILDLKTMGGSISLENSDVDGKVETMGGSISLENVKGDVDVKTMGGSISQRNVQGRNGSGKDITVTTMGGSISIDEAPNGASVKTMGGSISANKIGKFIEAETMGGSIHIDEIDGWVKAKTMGGGIEVVMVGDPNEGDRDVNLTSMGGDIELTVPKGLSMDIEIEIEYDRRDEGDVEIVSDVELQREYKGRDEDRKKRKIIGTGKTRDGKNKIRISTKSGSVYLHVK